MADFLRRKALDAAKSFSSETVMSAADKVIARHRRSLDLLIEAISHANRAYFFDTSEDEAWYFAEATDGTKLELKSDEIPRWFEPIWQHFG